MSAEVDTVGTVHEAQWRDCIAAVSAPARAWMTEVAQRHAADLANAFYTGMLKDPEARNFLSHEEVDQRLHASMQRWILDLFGNWEPAQVPRQVAAQRAIGSVHARIDIRADLVMRGARLLKLRSSEAMLSDEGEVPMSVRVAAALSAHALVDIAIEVMSAQYVNAHEMAARTDEAYRTFASTMNMSLERERQRTALLDWENNLLHRVMSGQPEQLLSQLSTSTFGLWVRHKASAIFRQSEGLKELLDTIERVDELLLPPCQQALETEDSSLQRHLRALIAETAHLRALIDALFDRIIDLETGRDALTQLLNRRFLPAVLSRETELCRHSGHGYALLLLDVDHFKAINDGHGHAAGDLVLQHLAHVLMANVRSGDSVFRYGGEEFLIVMVELNDQQALQVAEKVRQAVTAEPLRLADGQHLPITVSIGVATYDGHPDYQFLLERADRALYQAKHGGRNRCVLAKPAHSPA
ncbi:GGDEF domain-containing protein [Ideonella sp. B7]|uniref:GGDEF domain-containing protein n=1 Tax=Ideonella benzenivorans TaxID=2831643 RepID=UPI001CECA783|nr:GGDEF domain-containing protein [Ideonella benzenivorans]MCA6216794.1 GGDEF domain-containing protein [Ideonella benzenivorans]